MKKIVLSVYLALSLTNVNAADKVSDLQKILDGSQRSKAHKARDHYRHPLETLTFFDIKETDSVLEIWPGAEGWYTEILAPYLKEKGSLTVANFAVDAKTPHFQKSAHAFNAKLAAQPSYYNKVTVTTLQPPDALAIAPEGSMDRVLTFRNVHNWIAQDQAPAVFKAMYKALKPGGLLGVVEHRSSMSMPPDPLAKAGYVHEDDVIAIAMKAGFEFLAKSDVNANPNDTKDYPDGVWSLPPTLRQGKKDREKYLTIGESDRMTLKFIKLN
ncbi:MAG: methyltransferase [Methylococcaceae bacterium]